MSGTITGTEPNSGVPFSYDIRNPSANPEYAAVNTAQQNFAAAAAAVAARAGFSFATNPSVDTGMGLASAGLGIASQAGNINQGLTDLSNLARSQNPGLDAANQIEVGMMEGEANPLPAGTITGNDIGDPSPPAAPSVITPQTTINTASLVTPELDTSAGVVTSPGIHGFLVPEVGGGFLHIDPGAQMDGGDGFTGSGEDVG